MNLIEMSVKKSESNSEIIWMLASAYSSHMTYKDDMMLNENLKI